MPVSAPRPQGCERLLGRHATVRHGPIGDRRRSMAGRALVCYWPQEPHSGHDKHPWGQFLYGTLLGCRSSVSDTKFDNPPAALCWGEWTHRYPSRPGLNSWPCRYPYRERAGKTTLFFSSFVLSSPEMSPVNISTSRMVLCMPATSRHFSSPSTFTKTA